MNKVFLNILGLTLGLFAVTACMDDHDAPAIPDEGSPVVTSPVSVGKVNTTIGELKDRYCASADDADESRNASNFFSKVKDSICIEGVVVANDEGGNLYQTVMLRNIDAATGTDQSIILAVKNTCLYPYFSLGQRVKVQLKNLYVGCYSKVPRIGQPYWSSQGNLNLGPLLLEKCATNVELVGKPDKNAPELTPVVPAASWLSGSANQTYKNVPMLATVSGTIKEAQGDAANEPETGEVTGDVEPLPKIFGPEALHDKGFGVDRTLNVKGVSKALTIRTSTQNPVAFMKLPSDERAYTGILTYYSGWQMQVRSVKDVSPAIE